jgi:uncharacterized protein (DUF433 family)
MQPQQTTDRITVDPDVCNGRPAIRGTRVAVETVLGYLGAGDTAEDILRQHPQLQPEDIASCLAFASRLMSHRYTIKETV